MRATARNPWLLLGGAGSALVALLHFAIILAGPPAYRFFGAGDLAPLAEEGSLYPAGVTAGIAVVFSIFALARWRRRSRTYMEGIT